MRDAQPGRSHRESHSGGIKSCAGSACLARNLRISACGCALLNRILGTTHSCFARGDRLETPFLSSQTNRIRRAETAQRSVGRTLTFSDEATLALEREGVYLVPLRYRVGAIVGRLGSGRGTSLPPCVCGSFLEPSGPIIRDPLPTVPGSASFGATGLAASSG
jgi:hypothetical protein